MERYKVVKGSQSCHCCFEATVVDLSKPILYGNEQYEDDCGPQFDSVCECFDMESAELICNALNSNGV